MVNIRHQKSNKQKICLLAILNELAPGLSETASKWSMSSAIFTDTCRVIL